MAEPGGRWLRKAGLAPSWAAPFGSGLGLAVMLVSGIALHACGEEGVQAPVTLELFHVIAGSGDNSATGIAVDGAGNVYVAGDFEGSVDFNGDGTFDATGPSSIFIGKYGASGKLLWVKAAAVSTCAEIPCGRGYGVAVDGSGNTYVTGHFEGSADFDQDGTSEVKSAGSTDIFVAKYDASGILQWVRSAGGPSQENAQGFAVDDAGNSYVAGDFTGSADFNGDGESDVTGAGSRDIFVAKYDASGNLLWVNPAGGTRSDVGSGVAVDAAGNAYLTGWFQDAADFDRDEAADVTSAGGGFDSGYGIAVDDDGSAYVTGLFQGSAEFSDYDMFIAKYDQNGMLQWVKSLRGNRDRSPNVTGPGEENIFVAKYDRNGMLQWLESAGGAGSDAGRAIAVDGAGNAYITGWFEDDADFNGDGVADVSGAGIFVAKYGSDGTLGWVNSVTRSDDGNGRGIAVNGAGRAYVTGYFVGSLDLDGDGAADLTSAGNGDIFILITR